MSKRLAAVLFVLLLVSLAWAVGAEPVINEVMTANGV